MSDDNLHRTTDPITSHLAAAEVKRYTKIKSERAVLLAFKKHSWHDAALVEEFKGIFSPSRVRTARHELTVKWKRLEYCGCIKHRGRAHQQWTPTIEGWKTIKAISDCR